MKEVLDKGQVGLLYVYGFTAAEIAKELNVSRNTINSCIRRNFTELKDRHEESKRYRNYDKRSTIKVINYEANKQMSDRSFILKNRSIYKTNQDGDIVLREDLDCKIPWDAPRKLVNEFKKSC